MNQTRFWSPISRRNLFLILPYVVIVLLFIVIPIILIFVKSLTPTQSGGIAQNWNFVDAFIWQKILKSFIIAIITTFVAVIIAYPFSYFLAFDIKGKVTKTLAVLFITAPTWTSFLVKIIGMKTLFDFINGYQNSTSGDIYTVIGLVYLYIPFMILPIYNVWSTFVNVVLPYTKAALVSGITLVFLPCLTTVSVPQFLNSSSSGSLIGDIIMEEGLLAQTSDISLARASTLALIVFLFVVAGLLVYLGSRKISKLILKKWGAR